MTNKELIERAAKAARLPECGWMGDTFVYVKDNEFTDWNPLEDDGDAFRLAVDLSLFDGLYKATLAIAADHEFNILPHEATRLAIVRAAAELSV